MEVTRDGKVHRSTTIASRRLGRELMYKFFIEETCVRDSRIATRSLHTRCRIVIIFDIYNTPKDVYNILFVLLSNDKIVYLITPILIF
jgi:hypothetical protein